MRVRSHRGPRVVPVLTHGRPWYRGMGVSPQGRDVRVTDHRHILDWIQGPGSETKLSGSRCHLSLDLCGSVRNQRVGGSGLDSWVRTYGYQGPLG